MQLQISATYNNTILLLTLQNNMITYQTYNTKFTHLNDTITYATYILIITKNKKVKNTFILK